MLREKHLHGFHVCKGLLLLLLSNDDAGVARAAVFQEVQPGAGFKTGDFIQEKLRGATVVRLAVAPDKSKIVGSLAHHPLVREPLLLILLCVCVYACLREHTS